MWKCCHFVASLGRDVQRSGDARATSWLYAPLPNYRYWEVAHGGQITVCDVKIWRHNHVSKSTFGRRFLTQYAYYFTRTLLTRCCTMCRCVEHILISNQDSKLEDRSKSQHSMLPQSSAQLQIYIVARWNRGMEYTKRCDWPFTTAKTPDRANVWSNWGSRVKKVCCGNSGHQGLTVRSLLNYREMWEIRHFKYVKTSVDKKNFRKIKSTALQYKTASSYSILIFVISLFGANPTLDTRRRRPVRPLFAPASPGKGKIFPWTQFRTSLKRRWMSPNVKQIF